MCTKWFYILMFSCFAVFVVQQNAFSQEAKWNLRVCLPKALQIDCYYIDGKKYLPSEKFPANLKINKLQKNDCNCVNIAELSAIQLGINSNSGEPIQIISNFESLGNDKYFFNKENLSITPEQMVICDISKPTPKFIPYVKIYPDVTPGIYCGRLMFTISEL